MRFVLSPILATACAAALTTSAFAGYSTGFESSEGYIPGSLSFQNGWLTNNYYDPSGIDAPPTYGQSDLVGPVPGYSTNLVTDYWAGLGGNSLVNAPVVPTSYLFHPANVLGSQSVDFNVEFGISNSAAPTPDPDDQDFSALDSFAWTFRDSPTATASLLSVRFVPDNDNNPLDGDLQVKVFDSAGNAVPTILDYNIFYNSKYLLGLRDAGGAVSLSLTDELTGLTTQLLVNTVVAGANPALIDNVAATWILANTTNQNPITQEYPNFGSNTLFFDDFSVIPEPSSVLMAFGLLGVLSSRTGRKRSA